MSEMNCNNNKQKAWLAPYYKYGGWCDKVSINMSPMPVFAAIE